MDLDLPGSEEAVFQLLETNTFAIIDALLAVRPELKIILSSYDYPNFDVGFWCFIYACAKRADLSRDPVLDLITDAELNAMMVLLEERRRAWCAQDSRLLYDNSVGLMHHVYGDGVSGPRVLPKPGSVDPLYEPFPGGNPARPSLRSVFRWPGGIDADPIHLDFEGYQIKIGHQVEGHLLPLLRGAPGLSLASRGGGEDGWSDGVSFGTDAVRIGDASGRSVVGLLSFDVSALPVGASVTRAALWLTRSIAAGSAGGNPFESGLLGTPAVDVIAGWLGSSAQIEAGDASFVLDPGASDEAVDAGTVHGSARAEGYTLRVELDADARTAIGTGGMVQVRLRFPVVDAGDDLVSFATGNAGAWSLQTVSTFAEVVGSAQPMLDLTYDLPTGVALGDADLPAGSRTHGLSMSAPAPSPFNPTTVMEFSLERDMDRVELVVYDLSGRLVRLLYAGALASGTHARRWDGRDERGRPVGSGVYLVRLASDEGSVTRRAVLAK
jgi:hypothetical protein